MTNHEYHLDSAISKSDLDLIHKNPAYFQYCKQNPRIQTVSMLLGSVVHKLVLEHEDFDNEFAVMPKIDKRTKAGKIEYEAFLEANTDKDIVDSETYETACKIAESVRNHPIASKLLTNGKAEQSFFWKRDEIRCKCRLDWLRNDGIVVDLKTTSDASPEGFTKSASNFRYYVQAAWYLEGLKRNGINAENFIFIAVETVAPYQVCVYAADDTFLKLGETESTEDFEKYKKCVETQNFEGYETKIHSLSLPAWKMKGAEV